MATVTGTSAASPSAVPVGALLALPVVAPLFVAPLSVPPLPAADAVSIAVVGGPAAAGAWPASASQSITLRPYLRSLR